MKLTQQQEFELFLEKVNTFRKIDLRPDWRKFKMELGLTTELDQIEFILEREFKIPHGSLKGKTRKREVSDARSVFFMIVRCYGYSLKRTGEMCGGRDHTTVIHGMDKFRDLYTYDKSWRDITDRIFDKLGLFYNGHTAQFKTPKFEN